jgi:hypothetical protein
MNKRIRQLYIQAINDAKHDPADDINIQIAEKFAELIILEAGEAFWSEANIAFNWAIKIVEAYSDELDLANPN